MGRLTFKIISIIGSTIAMISISHAEYYKIDIKRIDDNLYKTSNGVYVETQYCYEYTYGEEAVLKYEDYSYDNKIIFDSGTTCEVKKIFK